MINPVSDILSNPDHIFFLKYADHLMAGCRFLIVKDCLMSFTVACGAGLIFIVTMSYEQLKLVNMLSISRRMKCVLTHTTIKGWKRQVSET